MSAHTRTQLFVIITALLSFVRSCHGEDATNTSKIIKDNSLNFKKCLLVIDKNISIKIVSKIKKSLDKKKLYIHFFKANEINKNTNKDYESESEYNTTDDEVDNNEDYEYKLISLS